jgi:Mrp family chromosome partitioning ATPase
MNDPRLHDMDVHEQPHGGGGVNVLHWVHYVLRGRYHWALLLALLLGGAAAYYLHEQVVPVYESRGTLRIRAYTPRLLYGNEASGRMPNFGTFMNEQVRKIRSDRVAVMAMESEPWRELGQQFTPEAQQDFRSRLRVWRSNETIAVAFKHTDRQVAEVATKCVIEAYERLFYETDPTQDRKRMQILDERRVSLSNQLNSLNDQIATFGDAFGPDGVRFRYQQVANRLRDLEDAIRKTEIEIELANARMAEDAPKPSTEALRQSHPQLALLYDELENRKLRLEALKRQHGEDHTAVNALQRRIDDVQGQIDDAMKVLNLEQRQEDWTRQWRQKLTALKAQKRDLASRLEQAKEQLKQVSMEKNRLQRLQIEADQVKRKLEEVRERIDRLNFESRMGDRLVVYEYGNAPQRPVNADEPRKQAMLGGAAGGSVGLALVMLLGLMNPKLRRSDDLSASTGAPKVLGMLPHLPDRLDDPEQVYFAGQCVHQIRMFLQLEGGSQNVQSFVVTGPETGTGKTSLAMALGFSYAAAGARTLMVDFDMIGAGLTSRLGFGRFKRLGRLLQEEGLCSAADIEAAANDLSLEGPLGEKLVARGLIEPEDVSRVLDLQQQSRVGLLDVLGGEPLDNCAMELPTDNLSLLSVGNATAEHISRVGRSAVKRFLKTAHEKYEVVLIDTGPVPGSVEASLIAAEADRVVLAVSRGDQMRRLNECQAFLRNVGARVAGVVFNRAEMRDMARSRNSMAHSVRSMSLDTRRSHADQSRRIGPVAVASAGDEYEQTDR